MKTKKLYYDDMFLKECEAIVQDVKGDKLVCDQTVAFPEGGGQIGDCGVIQCENGECIPFVDTQKGVGKLLHLSNIHNIQIDTPVYHIMDLTGDHIPEIDKGMKVRIAIDIDRRIKTTALHSSLHIVLMAAVQLRPNLIDCIKGCHIETDKARIDFFCENKFTADDLIKMNDFAKKVVDEDTIIERFLYQCQEEAWVWKCKDFECPCGGTHALSTGQLGDITIRRKNVGKTTERLIVTLDHIKITKEMYH